MPCTYARWLYGVPSIDSTGLKTVRDAIILYVKQQHHNKPIVIGHSLGSFMGLWIDSTAPELFGKLICVDGMPFYSALNDPNANADSLKNNPFLLPWLVHPPSLKALRPVVRCPHRPRLRLEYFSKMCKYSKLIHSLFIKDSRRKSVLRRMIAQKPMWLQWV